MNVTDPVLDYENKEIVEGDKTMTYRRAILLALNNFNPGEQASPEDKVKSFEISNKIMANDEIKFRPSESAYILQRGGVVLTPLVYGRLRVFLGEAKASK